MITNSRTHSHFAGKHNPEQVKALLHNYSLSHTAIIARSFSLFSRLPLSLLSTFPFSPFPWQLVAQSRTHLRRRRRKEEKRQRQGKKRRATLALSYETTLLQL